MVGGAIPGLPVQGPIRRWTGQTMGSKPVRSTHTHTHTSAMPLHQLLLPGSCPI